MNLQNQIRQKLVDGIINGVFAPGMKLPSSRKLTTQLDVARNTVLAAVLPSKILDAAEMRYFASVSTYDIASLFPIKFVL